jgi:mRNA interferase RelE/StbE
MNYKLKFLPTAHKEWKKLRASGYRLVYEVVDDEVMIFVIAVGKRDKNIVYKKAHKRK